MYTHTHTKTCAFMPVSLSFLLSLYYVLMLHSTGSHLRCVRVSDRIRTRCRTLPRFLCLFVFSCTYAFVFSAMCQSAFTLCLLCMCVCMCVSLPPCVCLMYIVYTLRIYLEYIYCICTCTCICMSTYALSYSHTRTFFHIPGRPSGRKVNP